MDWITAVVVPVVTNGLVLGAIGWVVNSLATHYMDKQVEAYRNTLERESTEHGIKFQSLHAQRAVAALEIWRKFKVTLGTVSTFVAPAQMGGKNHQDAMGNTAGEQVSDLYDYVRLNSIFFPSALATQIEELAKRLDSEWFQAWLDYDDARKSGKNPYLGQNPGELSAFGTSFKRLQQDVKPVLSQLEVEFRDLLGVEKAPRN